MATWEDVARLALALPDTTEESKHDNPAWSVHGKGFVWQRPLRKSDLAALGDDAPEGPILCAYVADVGVKDALIAEEPDVFFTTPHFNGFPAILIQLDNISVPELEEVVLEAWLTRAPKRLAQKYLDEHAS